jgi:hypothetical protein
MSEEKELEASIRADAGKYQYIDIFRKAQEVWWQREGDTVTECQERTIAVLMNGFSLKEPPQ